MLGDEELLKAPYSIDNQAHRRAVLAELDRVRSLGVKPPQNLWEYKVSSSACSISLWLLCVSCWVAGSGAAQTAIVILLSLNTI